MPAAMVSIEGEIPGRVSIPMIEVLEIVACTERCLLGLFPGSHAYTGLVVAGADDCGHTRVYQHRRESFIHTK